MAAPNDDADAIPADCGLIRHCNHEIVPIKVLPDGGFRVPSNAFHLREGKEDYLSVDIEALLERDKLGPTHHVPMASHWAARLLAGDVRALGLGVTPEKLPTNPHHGGIWGLSGLPSNVKKSLQKRLAQASSVLSPPKKSPDLSVMTSPASADQP